MSLNCYYHHSEPKNLYIAFKYEKINVTAIAIVLCDCEMLKYFDVFVVIVIADCNLKLVQKIKN